MVAEVHRVVIIGSGFGGLFATRALNRGPVEITLIDRTAQHLFQPLLYQVATGILSEGEIAPPTRYILRRQRNVRTLLGEVENIDLAARTVTSRALHVRTVSTYDTLIVAAGAQTTYFGNDEFVDHAPGLKSLDDALELRSRIFNAFEMAELETNPQMQAEWLTFAVVGAGATGVEMAGQIAELSHRALRSNFRSIDPARARIVLIDGANAPLGNFGAKLSASAANRLGKLGVELWLGNMVKTLDARSITLSDRDGQETTIAARTKVWSAGVAASPLAAMLAEQVGVTLARGGRIPVQPTLTLLGHPEVFVIGDMMALDDLPGVSPVAIQGGKYAADQIKRRLLRKESGQPFKYFDKGSMATVSRFDAVASVKGIQLSGFLAWMAWLAVHLFYLVGFKNRVATVFHWLVSFAGSDRSQRAGSHSLAMGRSATRSLGLAELGNPADAPSADRLATGRSA